MGKRLVRIGLMLAWCLATPVLAAPDITGPEARAFLGGRTGKVAYLKTNLRQIHFIDFSDSVLVERRVSDDYYCLSPMIHPDGTRIVYETGGAVWIRYLEEDSKDRFLVWSGTPRNGLSLEPHWWIHPKTGDEYITFSNGDVSEAEWPPKAGKTFIQKINKQTNLPEGPLQTLLPFVMSGGRSRNGMWGSTSHHSTGMYKLIPDKVADAFFSATNWQDSGALMACNASTSPSKDPARQDRMMHLTSGFDNLQGEVFENHKAILMRSWNDPSGDKPLWYMGIPGVRCNNDSSGNLFWEHPEWSTDEDYFTAVGSKIVEGYAEADLYMGRISYTGDSQIRRVLKGGGINHLPHLWVKDGIAPAKIRLGKTLVEFVSMKADSAGPRPDTIQVTNIGDTSTTLPPLKIGTLPAWLTVDILSNGTDTPRLVNRVDRAKAGLGDHVAMVKVSYGQDADSALYKVTFKYADPVLTALKPVPARAVLLPGDSVKPSALGFDQTGAPFPGLPLLAWQALDSLPWPASGWIKADSALAWKTFRFRASVAGGPACTTRVTVARILRRVDAGAPADSAPAGWRADTGAAASAPALRWRGALDLRAAADPAPEAVYRNARETLPPFTVAGLPDGRYAVRLHLTSVPPGRPALPALSVRLEGSRVLEDYRPPAGTDSLLKAEARDVQVTVSDGDGLAVELEPASAGGVLAGWELWDMGPPPVAVTHPKGGEIFKVGDTLRVRWTTDGFITSAGIQFSPDSGKRWIPVTRRSSVNEGQPDWGDYPWVIPDSLDGISLATSGGLISVYDYFGTDRDRTDRPFTILPEEPTRIKPVADPAAAPRLAFGRVAGRRLALLLPKPGSYRLSLRDLHGREAFSAEVRGPGRAEVPLAGLPRGIYRAAVEGAGLRLTGSVLLAE